MSRLRFALLLIASLALPVAALAGDKYALVVGVENYIPDQLLELDYAEDDALALAKALENIGFSVIAMTSEARNPLQKPATARQVLEQVSRRLADRQPADTIVLAFSGHGVQFKGEAETWFCPEQAVLTDRESLVPMSRVLAEIGRCRAGRKLLLVDACRDELVPGAAGKGVSIELDPAAPARAKPPAGTVAVFSCKPREKSYELADLGHSVFTHHVVEYLSGRAPANRYPGGELGVLEMASYVSSRTREVVDKQLGRSQSPEWIAPEGGFSEWPLAERAGIGGLAGVDRMPAAPRPAPSKPRTQFSPQPAGGNLEVIENSIGMKLVLIPAGEFQMGSNKSDAEKPIHRIQITKPFWIGQTEVTQGQFERVMKATPWRGESYVKDGPAVAASYVSWDDAVQFCRRLTDAERKAGRLPAGSAYRLPTEAEWEYACRAGTKTAFSFGEDDGRLGDYAWFDGNGIQWRNEATSFAHEVGEKRPNPWNLYDMHGNVSEWCSDWYDYKIYHNSLTTDPQGPPTGTERVTRGAGWYPYVWNCRSAFRHAREPESRGMGDGFRVVRSVE